MMDTENLIRTLALDKADAVPMKRAWALAAGLAAILAATVFWISLGPRPDIADAAAIIDRSGGQQRLDVPFHTLAALAVPTYPPDACPLCAEGRPVIKPGSRV